MVPGAVPWNYAVLGSKPGNQAECDAPSIVKLPKNVIVRHRQIES